MFGQVYGRWRGGAVRTGPEVFPSPHPPSSERGGAHKLEHYGEEKRVMEQMISG